MMGTFARRRREQFPIREHTIAATLRMRLPYLTAGDRAW